MSPPTAPVLLLTADEEVADRVVALGTACAVVVERPRMVPGPRSPTWRSRRLVLLGCDALDPTSALHPAALRECTARGSVVVVGAGHLPDPQWRRAVEVGADHVVVLPAGEPWLMDRLTDVASGPPRGRLLGVIGGRGGAGASTLAVMLALAAVRRRCSTLLVDGDPYGGGLDLLLGVEDRPGLRWGDVLQVRGRLRPRLLTGTCPEAYGVRLLSWGGSGLPGDHRPWGPAPEGEVMSAVLDAAAREFRLTVIDVARPVGAGQEVALAACHRVLLVVPAEVRAAAAASGLVARLQPHTADLQLVVRGPAPTGLPAPAVADLLGLPLAAGLAAEPGLAAVLDRGEAAAVRPRGPLGRFAAAVVDELVRPLDPDPVSTDPVAPDPVSGRGGRP